MPFPSLVVLDSFKRTPENPLSNGGKWKTTFEQIADGQVLEEFWQGSISGNSLPYWSVKEFTEPTIAAFIKGLSHLTENSRLWLIGSIPTPTSTNELFNILQIRSVGSSKSEIKVEFYGGALLNETTLTIAEGDGFALQSEGTEKVNVWHKPGAEEWKKLFEVSNPGHSKGYVGMLSVNEDKVGWSNFSVHKAEGLPTVENPGRQHSKISTSVSLQIKAENTTKYFAIGLPTGLSINETTGLITGETKVEESALVKIKVENGEAETAETSFEWDIVSGGTNVLGMIIG